MIFTLSCWYVSECWRAFWDMECWGFRPSHIEGSQWGDKRFVEAEMVLQGISQKEKWSYKVFVYMIYVPLSIIDPIRLKEPNQIW